MRHFESILHIIYKKIRIYDIYNICSSILHIPAIYFTYAYILWSTM